MSPLPSLLDILISYFLAAASKLAKSRSRPQSQLRPPEAEALATYHFVGRLKGQLQSLEEYIYFQVRVVAADDVT